MTNKECNSCGETFNVEDYPQRLYHGYNACTHVPENANKAISERLGNPLKEKDLDILDNLTEDQIQKIVRRVSSWAYLKQKHEKEKAGAGDCYPITPADIDHSSLLRRILAGRPIFKEKPPNRFSYPDYELASGRNITRTDTVKFKDESYQVRGISANSRVVIIDQSFWEIIKNVDYNIFIVRYYKNEKAKYILHPQDLLNGVLKDKTPEDIEYWDLFRLDEPEYQEMPY